MQDVGGSRGEPERRWRAELWTPRWLLFHATALILFVAFLALGWWQWQRAAAGNMLSYGYAVEWPAFAAFVVFVWIKEVRRPAPPEPPDRDAGPVQPDLAQAPSTSGSSARSVARRVPHRGPAYDDSDDAELAAYNKYLAWLNANPHASPADYPG